MLGKNEPDLQKADNIPATEATGKDTISPVLAASAVDTATEPVRVEAGDKQAAKTYEVSQKSTELKTGDNQQRHVRP